MLYRLNLLVTCLVVLAVPFSANAEDYHENVVIDFSPLTTSDYEQAWGMGFYGGFQNLDVKYYFNCYVSQSGGNGRHYEILDVNSFGDPVTGRYKELFMFNFGLMHQFSSYLSGYLGLGLASATAYAQKEDPSRILDSSGNYYVNDPVNDESGINLNSGVIFLIERLSLNIGYHSFASSTYFGVGYKI